MKPDIRSDTGYQKRPNILNQKQCKKNAYLPVNSNNTVDKEGQKKLTSFHQIKSLFDLTKKGQSSPSSAYVHNVFVHLKFVC